MKERKITGSLGPYPIKQCHRCGTETPHSPDGILCAACGLTTYTEEDNEKHYQKFTINSKGLRTNPK